MALSSGGREGGRFVEGESWLGEGGWGCPIIRVRVERFHLEELTL